ncbi:MAG: hypothetical protein P1U69_03250 [Parvibaculaceae bacterium]|nr:hypothetical protein [Parvibaculaceae bacterium]
MTRDRRHEIGQQTVHDTKTVEMLDGDYNSFMVGYFDKGEGLPEQRYFIYSITAFDGRGRPLKTQTYETLVPTDQLGIEAQNCLWELPSSLVRGHRRLG